MPSYACIAALTPLVMEEICIHRSLDAFAHRNSNECIGCTCNQWFNATDKYPAHHPVHSPFIVFQSFRPFLEPDNLVSNTNEMYHGRCAAYLSTRDVNGDIVVQGFILHHVIIC